MSWDQTWFEQPAKFDAKAFLNMQAGVALAPLWLTFASAATAGATVWGLTRWMRLAAAEGAAALPEMLPYIPTPEPAPIDPKYLKPATEAVEKAVEPSADAAGSSAERATEAVEAVAEPVVEALAEVAPSIVEPPVVEPPVVEPPVVEPPVVEAAAKIVTPPEPSAPPPGPKPIVRKAASKAVAKPDRAAASSGLKAPVSRASPGRPAATRRRPAPKA